ncbi:MAG: hypothetical protein WD492_04000 [Alkalispirochaeta sp.]
MIISSSIRRSGVHLLLVLCGAFLILTGVPDDASAGGSQEHTQQPESAGPMEGTITEIETTAEGDQILTVSRADGSEVYVDVPSRLARALHLQVGDRIRSEEHTMVEPGERLKVQRLSVERG